MGNSDNEDIKLFEKFKFIFWLDKFCLSLFLLIHFNLLRTDFVDKSIVLFASSTWASTIPVLSLISVIGGQLPPIISKGQAKLNSKIFWETLLNV